MGLLDADQATVDRAASQVPSVIDALVATIDPARRAALEPRIAAGNLNTGGGDEAAFLRAARCRRRLTEMPSHGGYDWPGTAYATRDVILELATRPFAPWLWVELLGHVPNHKRTLAEYIFGLGGNFADNYLPAARAAIRARAPMRGMLFERLRREDRLTAHELVDGLGDPPLRASCERLLASRVIDVASDLRDRLADATPGQRESIIRLLRTIDEHVDRSGRTSTTNLSELEARLRASPTDVETAQVWADVMQDAGDPRGALLALDLAIAQAPDRARMVELSAERAIMFDRDRKAVFGKPGGWPFRDKYLGRGFLAFGTSYRTALRGKPDTVRDKLERLFAELTDCEQPAVDGSIFHAHFKLTWPGTRTLLPYQEDGHYPAGFGTSSLRANTEGGKLEAILRFPFETTTDPGFEEVYAALVDVLGKSTMRASGFSIVTPTADGKRLKSKSVRYTGPA